MTHSQNILSSSSHVKKKRDDITAWFLSQTLQNCRKPIQFHESFFFLTVHLLPISFRTALILLSVPKEQKKKKTSSKEWRQRRRASVLFSSSRSEISFLSRSSSCPREVRQVTEGKALFFLFPFLWLDRTRTLVGARVLPVMNVLVVIASTRNV